MLVSLMRYVAAAQHVPPRRLMGRARREIRTRLIRAGKRLSPVRHDPAQCVERLRDPHFLAAAHRQRALVESFLAYDPVLSELRFIRSGDFVQLAARIPWNRPADIPDAELNRCHFIAFMEYAVLEDMGDPHGALVRVEALVARLHDEAALTGRALPIPWHPLAAARRLVSLLAFLALLLEADASLAGEPSFAELLKTCAVLEAHVAYLREDDLGFNHLASQLLAQALADHVFATPQDCASRVKCFADVVDNQLCSDGMQRERSATYQAHVLGHVQVLEASGVFGDHAKLARLRSLSQIMTEALGVLTLSDGDIALFNDSAIGDGPSPRALGVCIPTASCRLPDAGFYRLEQGDWSLVFDAGPAGADEAPGHAHADFLSFQSCLAGQRLVVDPGVASYRAGFARDWTRNAATHNGPRFIGLEPMDMWSAFRVGRRGRARPLCVRQQYAQQSAAGWQDGFELAGGQAARWLGLMSGEAQGLVDLWVGALGYETSSTFRIHGDWQLTATSGQSLTFAHHAGPIVRIECVAGHIVLEPEDRHFPFGPIRPRPAHCFTLVPEATAVGRVAALLWRCEQHDLAAPFSRDLAVEIASAMQAALLDEGKRRHGR